MLNRPAGNTFVSPSSQISPLTLYNSLASPCFPCVCEKLAYITNQNKPINTQVVVFGDKCILDDAIEEWPMCDCLVAFYSTGFPSEKAKAYVNLRRPYTLNNLEMEDVLHDRRRVSSLPRGCGSFCADIMNNRWRRSDFAIAHSFYVTFFF